MKDVGAAPTGRRLQRLTASHRETVAPPARRIVLLLAWSQDRGNNRVDFSWAKASIDKSSIQFRPVAVREEGRFRPVGLVDGKPEVAVINVARVLDDMRNRMRPDAGSK